MLGAIIGDIAGSVYEFHPHKSKDFPLFSEKSAFTDDTVMTLAVAEALMNGGAEEDYIASMQRWGRRYPDGGYGGRFFGWLFQKEPQPYNSFGNGSAMRVSACAYAANSLEQVKQLSLAVTDVTHNHPEGIKGAEAAAVAGYLARNGADLSEIRAHICENYYSLDFTLDEIRPTYRFNETCQDTVPQALEAFFESTSFEDAIRNAISVGGDSDTLAAITGGVAEAYYGIPSALREEAMEYLDTRLLDILTEFERVYPPKPDITK